ncbi:DUF3365 domain-containing protein [Pseudomonas stutzeri]|uniref:Glutamate synthase n=1 Tax=Stutzerimonas stutzeri KOS6 TaxID=1218352 RepID=A0A061JPE3_STUST|nr:DUF3365 domain-containing protein [Stutzerimonas stutzeri]EWC41591.1 glutamate synthase [Stutzerimonas stutzeri KOS6]MBK3867899.1 DUF3365 domain-containing protein [Stutzerimonas stutzeri]
MKSLSLLALGWFALQVHAAPDVDTRQLRNEAASLIPPFQQQLLGTVKQAMADGGPSKAVEACQLLAPGIAEQHSQAPWKVGRTALKLRNPDNAPDAWERAVLEGFAQRAAAGEPIEQLKHGAVVGNEYRYMQAIGTAEACLGCHGDRIKPELLGLIDQHYPQDQARGFRQGDLRGAFTLSRTLAP